MNDTQKLRSWIETLIDWTSNSLSANAKSIRDWESREASEQRELDAATAATDTEEVTRLTHSLHGVRCALDCGRASQAEYQIFLDRIRSSARIVEADAAFAGVDRQSLNEVKHELKRTRRVYQSLGIAFHLQPGASARSIALVESLVGYSLDEHLKILWRITDGSEGQYWFTDSDDGELESVYLNTFEFVSLSETLLRHWSPFPESLLADEEEEPRDARIQPLVLHHPRWFPFAIDIGDCPLQMDAHPAEQGKYGQIIQFVHDPDDVHFVADSFIELLRASNRALEAALTTNADELRKRLRRD